MIILGIDPGSRTTGFGIIDNQANRITYIASGNIKVSGDSLPARLGYIFAAVNDVIEQHQPLQMGIENVFMSRNADSALKLGQARGAAICAAHQAGLEIAEYAPREIKQAIVGLEFSQPGFEWQYARPDWNIVVFVFVVRHFRYDFCGR